MVFTCFSYQIIQNILMYCHISHFESYCMDYELFNPYYYYINQIHVVVLKYILIFCGCWFVSKVYWSQWLLMKIKFNLNSLVNVFAHEYM